MTCDICGPGDKREVEKSRLVGRTLSGYPVSCHKLECGHSIHRPGDTADQSKCNCSDRA